MTVAFQGVLSGGRTKAACANVKRVPVPLNMPVEKNGILLAGKQPDGKMLSIICIDVTTGDDHHVIPHPITFDDLDDTSKNTFVVESGSGGYHIYFYTPENVGGKQKCISTHPKVSELDRRGEGGIVFAPGTKLDEHPHEYRIVHDVPVKEITMDEFWRVWRLYGFDPVGVAERVSNVSIKDFLSGAVDVHVAGVLKDKKDEWLVWRTAMRVMEARGYTMEQWLLVASRLPGYDVKKCTQQTRHWWGHPELDKMMNTLQPMPVPTGSVGLDSYIWLGIPGGKTGWWLRNIRGTTIYEKVADVEVTAAARAITPPNKEGKVTSHDRDEIVSAHKDAHHCTIDDFIPDRDLVHYKNGIFLLPANELVPWADVENRLAGRQLKSFNMIPHDYKPDAAEIPALDEALALYFDPQDLENFWRWVGNCCTKRISAKKGLICDAPHGCGKSTLAKIMFNAIGTRNTAASISFHELNDDQHAVASLEGFLVMYDDDMGKRAVKDLAMCKKLLGFERVPCNPKFIQPYEMINTIHLWLLANNFPYVPGLTEDETAKFLLLTYRTNFETGERWNGKKWVKVEGIGDNKSFAAQFMNEATAEYIIRRAMEAYQEFLADGEKFKGASPKEVLDRWEGQTDILKAFIKEKCVLTGNNDDGITKDDLVESLGEFVHEKQWKNYVPDKRWITQNAHRYGFWEGRMRVDGSKPMEAYRGIKLKETKEAEDAETQKNTDAGLKERITRLDLPLTMNDLALLGAYEHAFPERDKPKLGDFVRVLEGMRKEAGQ